MPDAVVGYTDKDTSNIAAVIELKGASIALDRPQRREGNISPVQQGFKYKIQYRNCPFVIISNFWEFRLYHDNQLDYEVWTLDDLIDPADDYLKFKIFYTLLHCDSLTSEKGSSKTEDILSDIRFEQEEIGKKFYGVYREARHKLLQNIFKNNNTVRTDIDMGIEKAQKIIDRVVFACFAEDRGLLPDNTLQRVIKAADSSAFGGSLWNTIKGFFEAIDVGSEKLEIPEGYNGGLFKRDETLNNLQIGDDALREVLALSTYNFAEDLSVNILGHIFEQSISDLDEIKNKVNESQNLEILQQSRRKKDGIFYTPDYIVRYIVENSLGAYLREHEEKFKQEFGLKGDINDANYEKREKQTYIKYQQFLENVKIVDPACGSGAFLVYVFDYLMAENKRVASILGNLFSSDVYVKSILQNNIYGVDLNEESVEITKLSLWLKTAEKGKKLTALDKNIKCGNSLIDDPSVVGDKAFNWQQEFPEIFNSGGFDVVIGNPPWVFARGGNFSKQEKDYYYSRYPLANYQLNTYLLFVNLAHGLINKGGKLGFIIPNTCLTIDSFRPFREFLLKDVGNLSVINIFGSVFQDASVDSCIVIFEKTSPEKVTLGEMVDGDLNIVGVFSPKVFLKDTSILNISMMKNVGIVKLMNKIENVSSPLESYSKIKSGLVAYEVGKGNPPQTKEIKDQRSYHSHSKEAADYYEYLDGRDVCRYQLSWGGVWLKYGENLAAPRDMKIFSTPRILVRQIPSKPPYCIQAVYTEEVILNDRNSNNIIDIIDNPWFILSTLNSKLTSFWFINKFDKFQRGTFPQFKVKELSLFPIPKASDQGKQELAILAQKIHGLLRDQSTANSKFQTLVASEFNLEKLSAKTNKWWSLSFPDFIGKLKIKLSLQQKDELLSLFEKYRTECLELDNEIKKTDHEIDQIVYKLYGLTPEEINQIENDD